MHLAQQFEFNYENCGGNSPLGESQWQFSRDTQSRESGSRGDRSSGPQNNDDGNRRVTLPDVIMRIQGRVSATGDCKCNGCEFEREILKDLKTL